jgi:hypothetical protein
MWFFQPDTSAPVASVSPKKLTPKQRRNSPMCNEKVVADESARRLEKY